MEGPSEDFRREVAGRIRDIASREAETDVERLLDEIVERAGGDASDITAVSGESEAADVLAAVESWAALASSVVTAYYAPASLLPFRGGVGGWSKGVPAALQKFSRMLQTPLRLSATALGATSWSIGVGFPFGVQVTLTWT